MGNVQARQRIKAEDFEYLCKFTGFVSFELLNSRYDELMEKYKDGNMEKADFIQTFHVAFPTRPEDKVNRLAEELANKDGKISMANMMILFYLFCSGKTEDNLAGMFNLFDMDGNKGINISELYEMMASFIEIAEGKDNQVDLAVTVAEVFNIGDRNKDDKLTFEEFHKGMFGHPLTDKILRERSLDSLLANM